MSHDDELLLRGLSISYPTSIAPTYLLISRSKYTLLALIPHFLSPLSICGSLALIYRIVQFDRHEIDAGSRRTYHRLLVAMSICDIFGCIAFFFGSIPVPRETLLSSARGNTATCTAQGFLIHVFVLAVRYYNTGLMIYFLMTIRYGWTETYLAKRVEPFIHIWAVVVPLAEGVAGIVLEIFNPIGFGAFCHIAPYPPLCELFDACRRGYPATYLYIAFCIIPESILLVVIYVSIVLIYCAVRGQATRALGISANQDTVRARTKSVAVQSWLFAIIFFNTWIYAVLSPILAYAVKPAPSLVKSEFVLSLLTEIFLPMQGFCNFLIYIRPRFMRLWKDERISFGLALKLAAFGGRHTSSISRRRSMTRQRKRSSQQWTLTLSDLQQETITTSPADETAGSLTAAENAIVNSDNRQIILQTGQSDEVRNDGETVNKVVDSVGVSPVEVSLPDRRHGLHNDECR